MSVFVSDKPQINIEENQVDVSALMRRGHPQIPNGDQYILKLVKEHCQRLGRPARILDLCCGSGYFAAKLIKKLPDLELIANEDELELIPHLQNRLGNTNAKIFPHPFTEWNEPLDIVISWGSFHHLPRHYLDHAKKVLGSDGILILGDEFCPEYCDVTHAERINQAEIIHIADGYVLTNTSEVETYQKENRLSPMAIDLEKRRQQALWIWYRYVVDFAMAKNCLEVATYELRAAHDDLLTNEGEEHKMSPLIAEQELKLMGFKQLSKQSFCSDDTPELQSFFVYEFTGHC